MIGNNSCGMHAQMAGKVEENIRGAGDPHLRRTSYVGRRHERGGARTRSSPPGADAERSTRDSRPSATRTPTRSGRNSLIFRVSSPGYPLQELLPEHGFNVARALVGTENTCVTILQAKLRLVHSPPSRTLVVFGFPDIFTAGDQVPFCNAHQPIAFEGLDGSMFTYMHDKGMSTAGRAMLPQGNAWLIVEFGGDSKDAADKQARAADGGLSGAAQSAEREAHRRRDPRETAVGDPGVGPRRDVQDPAPAGLLSRVGRLGGRAKGCRQLSPRLAAPLRQVWLHGIALRPFRSRVHPL